MDYTFRYITPEGFNNLLLCLNNGMLTGLGFENSQDNKHKRHHVGTQYGSSLPTVLMDTIRWLDIYFSGCHPNFTPLYQMEDLTPFRYANKNCSYG